MQSELAQNAKKLQDDIKSATEKIDLENLQSELKKLQKTSQSAEFWSDNQKATQTMKQIAKLEQQIKPWEQISSEARELNELSQFADKQIEKELNNQLKALQQKFDELKKELAYNGQFDNNNAIVSIYAGAGGTDAQDWSEMLMRMYTRFAEQNNYKATVIDTSSGDEAGIKSATLEIEGHLAYGKLKGEHGVHRLVRLSPFNSDNLRQTSFAKVEVLPMIEKPEEVEIDDKDLKIDVFRSGGHGGQSVNTTDSAVRVTYIPTGTVVTIQNERSQIQNKETAMIILRSKLARLQLEQHQEKISELKGPKEANEWGSQIRNYVLHPYKQVKDLRTGHEVSDPEKVLGGDLSGFIEAYNEHNLGE